MKFKDKKVWVSFLSAIIFGTSAVSALSTYLNLNIGYIPDFLGNDLALKIFLMLAGVILLYDSFSLRSSGGHANISSIIAGFVFAFLGAFPLLNQLGLLDFLPFVLKLTLSPAILAGLLLFYSIYLIWDTYLLIRTR